MPDPVDLDALDRLIAAATAALADVCRRDWRMRVSVPARPDQDDDLVIFSGLTAGTAALAELRAARAELRLKDAQWSDFVRRSGDDDRVLREQRDEARAELARRDAELREASGLLSKAVPRLAEHLRHARARNELDALQATNDLADIRAFLEARP